MTEKKTGVLEFTCLFFQPLFYRTVNVTVMLVAVAGARVVPVGEKVKVRRDPLAAAVPV